MGKIDSYALVHFLRTTPRTRVALWRCKLNQIGKELDIAAGLGIEALDLARYYLDRIPAGADFARLSRSKVYATFDAIASTIGASDCVLIYNVDLIMAGLKVEERQLLWQDLYNHFPNRLRSLIIFIPDNAKSLLPSDTLLEKWDAESRLL